MAYFGIKTLDEDFPKIKGLIFIKEDECSNNHLLFIKIFCAANNFKIYGIGNIDIPSKILIKKKINSSINKIAWKYKNKEEENIDGFDMINTNNIICSKYISLNEINDDCIIISLFSPIYFEILNKNPLDLINNININNQLNLMNYKNIIYKELFQLRRFIKMSNKTVFITIPSFLYSNSINWNLYADFVFKLDSYEYYNGLLIVEKGGFNKYGFRINSKGILLEEVIIPPEGLNEKDNLYDF